VSTSETHAEIQQQIQREKIGALQRAVEALEAALAALGRNEAAGGSPAERAELVSVAGERLWYVVIQREAIGVMRHDVLFDALAVPLEVRRAMGPRLRRRGAGRAPP
jgi:hypothetical protein